jgi:hypothetical protein
MDPCCVETAPLSRLIGDFASDWRATRRPRPNGYCARPSLWNDEPETTSVEPILPYEWIAAEASHVLARDGWALPAESVRKLRNPRRYPLAELRVADAIVAAIGEPGMFYDGTLVIFPNPRLPAIRAAECCGGSELARSVPSGAIVRAVAISAVTAPQPLISALEPDPSPTGD